MIDKEKLRSVSSLKVLRAVREENCKELHRLRGELDGEAARLKEAFSLQNIFNECLSFISPVIALKKLSRLLMKYFR